MATSWPAIKWPQRELDRTTGVGRQKDRRRRRCQLPNNNTTTMLFVPESRRVLSAATLIVFCLIGNSSTADQRELRQTNSQTDSSSDPLGLQVMAELPQEDRLATTIATSQRTAAAASQLAELSDLLRRSQQHPHLQVHLTPPPNTPTHWLTNPFGGAGATSSSSSSSDYEEEDQLSEPEVTAGSRLSLDYVDGSLLMPATHTTRQPAGPQRRSPQQLNNQKQQQQQQQEHLRPRTNPTQQTPRLATPTPMGPLSSMPALDLNMGADRMMIKHSGPPPSAQQPSTGAGGELTEQVAPETSVQIAGAEEGSASNSMLLYPTPANIGEDLAGLASTSWAQRTGGGATGQQLDDIIAAGCYSWLALLAAALSASLASVIICVAVNLLIKHLGRHQFDLVAKSKQFAESQRRHFNSNSNNNNQQLHIETVGAHLAGRDAGLGRQARLAKRNSSSVIALFGPNDTSSASTDPDEPIRSTAQVHCAFDNPYFGTGSQRQSGQHNNDVNGRLSAAAEAVEANDLASEQVHSIQDRISNLHNCQVTSSVRQLSQSMAGQVDSLSSSAGPPSLIATATGGGRHQDRQLTSIVDLTGNRSADAAAAATGAPPPPPPRQGDLLSVSLTGHDFVGLGFDLCGGRRDGIFVKTVQLRGPARESGCVDSGDRIKGLSVEFDESMSLEDAFHLLNYASPYKMRLLLEKGAATNKNK